MESGLSVMGDCQFSYTGSNTVKLLRNTLWLYTKLGQLEGTLARAVIAAGLQGPNVKRGSLWVNFTSICSETLIGFSHEFVPIMFQKNEKKNCKKTIWLSYFLKVNMSLFDDQLKLLTPLFSLCYIWCTILNIYFCSLLHDVYYVICYILKWKRCRWYTWR